MNKSFSSASGKYTRTDTQNDNTITQILYESLERNNKIKSVNKSTQTKISGEFKPTLFASNPKFKLIITRTTIQINCWSENQKFDWFTSVLRVNFLEKFISQKLRTVK